MIIAFLLVFFGANEAVFLLPVFSVNRRQQVMKRRAARFDWLVLLTFVLAVAIEGVVYYWQIQPVYYFGEGTKHIATGQVPPTGFALRDNATGNQFNLVDKRDQVVWLLFWGPWDGQSRLQLPEFNELYETRLKKEPRLWVSSVLCEFPQYQPGFDQGMMPAMRELYDEHGLTLPIFLDETGDARRAFDVRQDEYPTNVILDAKGVIRGIWTEYYAGLQQEMLKVLQECLDEIPLTDAG